MNVCIYAYMFIYVYIPVVVAILHMEAAAKWRPVSGHESGGRPEETGPYVSSGCPPLCCSDIGFDFWTQQVYPCTCGACGIMWMRGGSLEATNVQSLRHRHGRLVGTPQ